jgi:hypothetical protein
MVLGLGHWEGIKDLLTVTSCPYLVPDGGIISWGGYDPVTKSLLVPSFKLAPVPRWPGQADARDAIARIMAPLDQFPFKAELDKMVFLAALLTAIQRPVILDSVPGFAFVGNKAGIGKSFLCDVIAAVVLGTEKMATTAYNEDKKEMVKTLLAIGLCGLSCVNFDNLEDGARYGSSVLDSALTTGIVSERVLGFSQIKKDVAIRCLWFINGNNIEPSKGAIRRWLPSNLESPEENPHERLDIKDKDLIGTMLRNRGQYVADCLTIIKAHQVAGSPKHPKGPLGSFYRWDDMIRSAIYWATGYDVVDSQREARKWCTETTANESLLMALSDYQEASNRGDGWRVSDIFGDLVRIDGKENDAYASVRPALMALGENGKPPDEDDIGYKLRSLKDNPMGDMKLIRLEKKLHGCAVWQVQSLRTIDPGVNGTVDTPGFDFSSIPPRGGFYTQS